MESFDKSPLDAFVRSPLDARNTVGKILSWNLGFPSNHSRQQILRDSRQYMTEVEMDSASEFSGDLNSYSGLMLLEPIAGFNTFVEPQWWSQLATWTGGAFVEFYLDVTEQPTLSHSVVREFSGIDSTAITQSGDWRFFHFSNWAQHPLAEGLTHPLYLSNRWMMLTGGAPATTPETAIMVSERNGQRWVISQASFYSSTGLNVPPDPVTQNEFRMKFVRRTWEVPIGA